MMLAVTGCGKQETGSNITFTQIKTTGVVESVSPDKITMRVLQEDANFKKDDQAVVTFQNIYLKKSQSKSDVLEKTDKVSAGDTVYVIYDEEQRQGNVIHATALIKEEE